MHQVHQQPSLVLHKHQLQLLQTYEATTLAGLVIHEAQIIPDPGQTFTFHKFRFEILQKSRNQITSIRVTSIAK